MIDLGNAPADVSVHKQSNIGYVLIPIQMRHNAMVRRENP